MYRVKLLNKAFNYLLKICKFNSVRLEFIMKKFSQPIQLETPRLIIRQWKTSDFEPFAQLNADPEVMAHFPATLSKAESDTLAHKIQSSIAENGWGFWAIELKERHQFIGFTGLHNQPEQFEFSPCVEIGWRFAKEYWHQGYATEAAEACLNFAFQDLNLKEVVAFTATSNQPSEKVMQRLGMTFIQKFNHPALKQDSPLRGHILYKMTKNEYFKYST